MNDIYDVRPPADYPSSWQWLLILLVLVIASVIAWLIRKWWLQKKMVKAVSEDLWQKAYRELKELEASGLWDSNIEVFYVKLSTIVRHYLEKRFSIKAPEMTTEEFLQYMNSSEILPAQHRPHLEAFLISCDMVKFARYQPGKKEAQDGFAVALRLIEETKPIEEKKGT